MSNDLVRGMRRSLACILVAACMPLPPMLANGTEVPEHVVTIPNPVPEREETRPGRCSIWKVFALGTLCLSASTYWLGGYLPEAPVMPPAPSGPGIDFATDDLGLVPASTASDAPCDWPAAATSARAGGRVVTVADDLPKPRAFRLVRNPNKTPGAKALKSFAINACRKYHKLLPEAAWAVTHHWRDQRLLAEGLQCGVSLPVQADLEANEKASRIIVEMYSKVRDQLGRHRCFELRPHNPRARRPYGTDFTGARAFILKMEAELNVLYEEFLAFARQIIEEDQARIEPPSGTRMADLADAAKTLERTMRSLEEHAIGR